MIHDEIIPVPGWVLIILGAVLGAFITLLIYCGLTGR